MCRRKITVNKLARDEKGYALILVLILLLLGSLLIPPLLGYMATGLKTGLVYEKKTNELYAADAGIEEGLWRIKYDYWGEELQHRDYDIYDFNTTWSYLTESLNGGAANVSIQNIWIPTEPKPSAAQARAIIESGKLVVTGTAGATPGQPYYIKIDFTPATGDNLTIKSVGVWLPQGFTYVDRSCTLDQQQHAGQPYYALPTKTIEGGGQAVVWSYDTEPLFTYFPNFVSENGTMTSTIAFNYTPPPDDSTKMPAAIAWVTTKMLDSSGVPKNPDSPENVPISWDTDTRIYKITSSTGNTSIEAYSSKCEMRRMGNATSGDYVAIGNSLMIGNEVKRDVLLPSSSTDVTSIPADADVTAAYLYWSGYRDDSKKTNLFSDTCDSSTSLSNNWVNGGDWSYSSNKYQGQHTGDASRRYLTMKNKLNLSSYPSGQVVVSWIQCVSGSVGPSDGLDFAFSFDNGNTWSSNIQAFRGNIGGSGVNYYYFVPAQYLKDNFKLRFYLVGMGTGKYCNLDDIRIDYLPPDTSIAFSINDQQVYLDANGDPQAGNQSLTAGISQVIPNTLSVDPTGFYYACHRDVSKLVKKYPVVLGEQHHTGNSNYRVGDVGETTDLGHYTSYAGWSLIIIYSSPETAGHYLYLHDVFAFNPQNTNLDFDGDGQPGGDITGFVIPEPIRDKYGVITETEAAKLTCFVGEGDNIYTGDSLMITGQQSGRSEYLTNSTDPWNNVWNGLSPGCSYPGIDVDPFQVLWSDKILTPNDTRLHLDMVSTTDAWNLIYIIVSVRSVTVTGGTPFYLIR